MFRCPCDWFHPFSLDCLPVSFSLSFLPSQVHSPEGQILWTAPFNVGHAAPVPPTAKYERKSHCYMTLLDDGSLTLYGTTDNNVVKKNFPIMWTSDTCKV
jgi:hypothetical protein